MEGTSVEPSGRCYSARETQSSKGSFSSLPLPAVKKEVIRPQKGRGGSEGPGKSTPSMVEKLDMARGGAVETLRQLG